MIYLLSIDLKPGARERSGFPFTLPLVPQFEPLRLESDVTFFVGENGSGKSTLLESIAANINLPSIGGADLARDKTLQPARDLGKAWCLGWREKTKRGFFLRAEDFFNFTRRMKSLGDELQDIADGFSETLSGEGLERARGYVLGQRQALIHRYGNNLDANSHGESFLKLFRSRFVPGGLYLLDEPEAPLSPQRQLALLAMIKEMVAEKAQFIIATHSPILMAYPDAQIFSFDQHPVRPVAFDEVEHVELTRRFLANPAAYLRLL
jgi:predicted ATPase